MNGSNIAIGAAALLALAAAGKSRLSGSRSKGRVDPKKPIGLENMSDTKELVKLKSKEDLEDLAEGLRGAVEDEQKGPGWRHFPGRYNDGEDWFSFNIKAHGARPPDWVYKILSEETISVVQDGEARGEIECLIFDMKNEESPLHQEWWWPENYEIQGSSGGYIGFQHQILDVLKEAEEILEEAEPGEMLRGTISGVKWKKDGPASDVLTLLNRAEYMLQQRDRLEREIKKRLTAHEKTIQSDDFWESLIQDNEFATAEEVAQAKAGDLDKRKKVRSW
jgi:hypothetical protein